MSQYRTTSYTGRRVQSDRWRRNQNTIVFASPIKLGPVTHTVLVALMIAVLGLIYLTQITKTSTYGYELSDLDIKKSELLSQKENLEVETARLQAMERVRDSNVARGMDDATQIEHVRN